MPRVQEVMTTSVVFLRENMTLCKATEVMTSKGVSAAPVVDDAGKLVGILSERDILDYAKCMEGEGFSCPSLSFLSLPYERIVRDEALCRTYEQVGEAKVSDAMNSEVVTIGPNEDVDEALETMVRFEINHLPVVANEKLVGIIARQDVLWSKCRQSLETPRERLSAQ